MRPFLIPLSIPTLCLLLAACGDHGRQTVVVTTSQANAVQEAVSKSGDVTIRANVIQTSQLNETVARQYGIERSDRRILLLVAVRQGPEAREASLPATIIAKVSRLQGGEETIQMHEQRTGELLDYVGTVETTLPETLRFDLTIVRENGATSTMQFSREFLPR